MMTVEKVSQVVCGLSSHPGRSVITHFLVSIDIIPPEQSPEKPGVYPAGPIAVALYIPICSLTDVPDIFPLNELGIGSLP